MKKVLLSSVAALAVFAAAAPVFANNQGEELDATTTLTGTDLFLDSADKDFNNGLTQRGKDGLNVVDAASTKDKFKAAGEDIKAKPGTTDEFVVSSKAADKKAADKKAEAGKDGQKALPKTSAAK